MLYERGETLAWCSVPASCFNICSGEEKRVKVTPHVILDITGSPALLAENAPTQYPQ